MLSMRNELFNTGQTTTLLDGSSYTVLANEVVINGVVYSNNEIDVFIKDVNPKATLLNIQNFTAQSPELARALSTLKIGVKKVDGTQEPEHDSWLCPRFSRP